MMPTPPGFYLPECLMLGVNCRDVRVKQAARRAQLAAASSPKAANEIAPSAAPDDAPASSAAPASTPVVQPPPLSLAEWALEKLLDQELQQSMESQQVLNSWDEGSHLSVIKTDGDGSCLTHAVMTAVYGYPDSDAVLRDAIYWGQSQGRPCASSTTCCGGG
jgi:hypothetical protein